MMKRADVINPRVFRKVLPAEELYTVDLETGRQVKKMVYCQYHKRMEWIADFYLESSNKRRHSNDVRSMCIEGWDITFGKTKIEDKKVTATLMDFIGGYSND